MTSRALTRRQGRQLVERYGVPAQASFAELADLVGRHRGTRITVQDSAALNGARICGAWTGSADVDTIHVPSDAKESVKLFIACHELGHMLAEPVGRESRVADSVQVREFLASVLNSDRIVPYAFRGTDALQDQRELEAEVIGDQLALRVLRARRGRQARGFRFERVFTE